MDRPKMGFNIPYENWFKNDLKNELINTLSEVNINSFGLVNAKVISKMLVTFFNNGSVDFQRIWQIYNFQLWAKKWL